LQCDVFYRVFQRNCPLAREGWCCATPGFFDSVKWQFREQFWKSSRVARPFFQLPLKVAWHIRVGDIEIDRENTLYFKNVFLGVRRLLDGINYQMFIIHEGNLTEGYRQLINLCEVSGFCVLVSSLSVREAVDSLIFSDVLITSGSSFADMAAMYHRGVVLMRESKDGPENCYKKSSDFAISLQGRIVDFREARARVRYLLTLPVGR